MDLSSLSNEELLSAAGIKAPLSVRNNNPLNMRPVGATQGFQAYDSPQAGIDAARNDLLGKIEGRSPAMNGKAPTLFNIVNTWAPPSENNTSAYLQNVAMETGFNPDQPLTAQDLDRLIPAMIKQEGGPIAAAHFAPQQADLSGLSDDELIAAAGIQSPQAQPDPRGIPPLPPEQTFSNRLSENLANRTNQISGIADQAVNGDISQFEALARSGLKYAQLLPDAAGSAIAQVTPDAIKEPLSNAASYLANTDAGRATIGAINDFQQNHPVAAGRIGSGLDALNIAAPFAKIGGTSVVSGLEDTAKASGKLAAQGARAVGSAALPSVDDGLREVAQLAQKYKIPVSLDQVAGSRTLKNAQKVSQELPFSGQDAFRDNQLKAYNKALFNTVGMDADKFTPANMAKAFSQVGGEFDALTKGQTFQIGGDFIDNLAKSADEIASTYGAEAAEVFQREAAKVIDDFSGDTIPGELIARQRARINGLARKAGPNTKGALLDLENNIVEGITSGDPGLQQALSAAKGRYKNLIVLEPLAVKAKGGNISPSLLNNRVAQVYKRAHTTGNSGEIGELARIGAELLPELGGSDTTQKMLYALGAKGVANVATGTAALGNLPLTAAGLTANRIGQRTINRNQSLIKKALSKAEMKEIMKLPPREAMAILSGAE